MRQSPLPLMSPARRLRNYLHMLRLMVGELGDQVRVSETSLSDQITQVQTALSRQHAQLEMLAHDHAGELSELQAQVTQLLERERASGSVRAAEHLQMVEILRFVHDQGHTRRRQLRELRAAPEYDRPYVDAEPLVSVVIPTYDNHELLRERAIPSVLAQTHQNLEIVVVGDAAPDAARTAAESFGDRRITFVNLPYRGPYPENPEERWLVAGVPPYNEGVRRATGLWIAPLDDDDAFRPTHIARLLAHAREERLEVAYGQMRVHFPGGGAVTVGAFPPERGHSGLQSMLYHAGLAEVFELELADASFGRPYDFALVCRMQQAGVRIGMLEEALGDYFPSRYWTPRWDEAAEALPLSALAGPLDRVEAQRDARRAADTPADLG